MSHSHWVFWRIYWTCSDHWPHPLLTTPGTSYYNCTGLRLSSSIVLLLCMVSVCLSICLYVDFWPVLLNQSVILSMASFYRLQKIFQRYQQQYEKIFLVNVECCLGSFRMELKRKRATKVSVLFQIVFCLLLLVKVGLGNFWNVVVISLVVVEKAEKYTRLCPQVGVACSDCSCVLEVMLSEVLGHVGWEYGCEVWHTQHTCAHTQTHTCKYHISSSSTCGYF